MKTSPKCYRRFKGRRYDPYCIKCLTEIYLERKGRGRNKKENKTMEEEPKEEAPVEAPEGDVPAEEASEEE